jgi:hypothetical protein
MCVQEKEAWKVLIDVTRSANLHSGCLVQDTIRLRRIGGGHSVCESSVCTLSGTVVHSGHESL